MISAVEIKITSALHITAFTEKKSQIYSIYLTNYLIYKPSCINPLGSVRSKSFNWEKRESLLKL